MPHSPSPARGGQKEGTAWGAGKGQSLEVFNSVLKWFLNYKDTRTKVLEEERRLGLR